MTSSIASSTFVICKDQRLQDFDIPHYKASRFVWPGALRIRVGLVSESGDITEDIRKMTILCREFLDSGVSRF
jgi:hypothetical protein